MKVKEIYLGDCLLLEPAVFADERGYFFESFNEAKFNTLAGRQVHFVQDNQSFSTRGVLRGLHFQLDEHAQAKLVRVLKGEVLDVAVDIRPESPTFGEHFSVVLSAANRLQLFIPRGFAHGFVVLSEDAEFFYKCDNYYNKDSEGSIHYADAELAIDWSLDPAELIVSEKDGESRTFAEFKQRLKG
ncbi:dTDP-4-dehydrorhamnose 3,5-epimerase [Pontibacter sp. HSC-14F20]|uniref:dTDP-4-dehydrorhamnose 3,5-epimerase n=1 Tax=Pontibacter sp. HSC-14F20 TaxID=2864136 RepID=UPI001C72CF05|nr:dTDP-4-dehydrorhamnose 3,5-epimerase [Pontibacter sp. HSC-14F20]MBX0335084.1 dTDP-4-dehydrorhamnose 3,5-epimerase [Pontibacter sp. HSC-14F20]